MVTGSGDPPMFVMVKYNSSLGASLRLTLKVSVGGETFICEGRSLMSMAMSFARGPANAGRANAAIRNRNEKLRHAADRVNDLFKRIEKFLPTSGVRTACERSPHPANLSSEISSDEALKRSQEGGVRASNRATVVRICQNKHQQIEISQKLELFGQI